MELKLVLEFIKKYWVQSLIVVLMATIFYLHLNNNVLESELALSRQETQQEKTKLETSNATISQLQSVIDAQNQKLNEISTIEADKVNDSKLKLILAKQTNKELQDQLKELQDFKESGNICTDIGQILKNIGE